MLEDDRACVHDPDVDDAFYNAICNRMEVGGRVWEEDEALGCDKLQ